MKKVITIVGTSLFENYMEHNSNNIKDKYDDLKEKLHKEWKRKKRDVASIKKSVLPWAKSNEDASAEIRSLLKIQQDVVKDEMNVYLLATDTVLSRLSADIIQERFKHDELIHVVSFNPGIHVITDLQIWDKNKFEENGLKNLFERLDSISKRGQKEDVILNITGGYKGVIPYLTIFAQLKEFRTFYLFENSENIIRIPRLPVQFDWGMAEQYYPYLSWDLNLNEVEEKVKRGLKREIGGLKQFRLMNTDQDGKWKVTAIGKMFKEFIDRELPIAKSVLGYFVEYKLFEYYMKNPYQDRYNIVDRKGGEGEPDLILQTSDDSSDFIVVESKSSLQFGERHFKKNAEGQFRSQIDSFRENGIPKEYHLCIYIYQEYQKDLTASAISELKEMFQDVCDFKVFYLYIDLSCEDPTKREKYYRNPYQKFVDNPITLEN